MAGVSFEDRQDLLGHTDELERPLSKADVQNGRVGSELRGHFWPFFSLIEGLNVAASDSRFAFESGRFGPAAPEAPVDNRRTPAVPRQCFRGVAYDGNDTAAGLLPVR